MSLFQKLNCMQELFLGKEKVSLLERCPHFRGVLREGSTVFAPARMKKRFCTYLETDGSKVAMSAVVM